MISGTSMRVEGEGGKQDLFLGPGAGRPSAVAAVVDAAQAGGPGPRSGY